MNDGRKRYLSVLPELPLWVEKCALLLREGSKLLENHTRNGFVVWSAEDGSGSVVGEPKPSALVLVQAVSAVPELLAFADNIERVRTLLPGFSAELAFVFSAPELFPPPPPDQCREMSLSEIAAQDHLSDDRLAQLSDVAEGGVPVAAAFDGMRPVAFAYVASESESLMNQRKWCPKAK